MERGVVLDKAIRADILFRGLRVNKSLCCEVRGFTPPDSNDSEAINFQILMASNEKSPRGRDFQFPLKGMGLGVWMIGRLDPMSEILKGLTESFLEFLLTYRRGYIGGVHTGKDSVDQSILRETGFVFLQDKYE
jgi:hypothetical protein